MYVDMIKYMLYVSIYTYIYENIYIYIYMHNIHVCYIYIAIANMVRTSLGPNGMNKLVVNHLEKIIVTSDCATIMNELEVQHPAAKMLVMACEMQQSEYGDNTNFVSITNISVIFVYFFSYYCCYIMILSIVHHDNVNIYPLFNIM